MTDEEGNQDPFSQVPNQGQPLTPFVEEDPHANRIAHRELKVRIGEALEGKKVTWTLEPLPGADPATIRGEWSDSQTHSDRFEASVEFGANGFNKTSQEEAETTVAADGHTAIRVNVPPVGFNQVRIKIQIEGSNEPIELIDMEVPAVVVIDAGHGGPANSPKVGGSSWNNATADPSGTLEKTMTLDFAKLVESRLKDLRDQDDLNLRIFMTRTTDVNLGLATRANIARDNGADIFMSIHFNGYDNTVRGTEAHIDNTGNYNREDDLALSERLSNAVFGAISSHDAGANNRGARADRGLDALSDPSFGNSDGYTPVRGSLLEVEFIDVEAVDELLNTNENKDAVRTSITDAIGDAIIEDLREYGETDE